LTSGSGLTRQILSEPGSVSGAVYYIDSALTLVCTGGCGIGLML
jgi:hypothetical protein